MPAPRAGSLAADAGTSRLIEELARVCAELPLEEKVLVAPSLAAGHTLVERLAREGHPWINLRVETVRTLALAAVGSELAREGLRLLSRAQALALVEQACSETLTARSYFGELRDRPGLHRALQATLDELRGAGIDAAAIPASAFSDPRKPREIRAVLARYAEALAEGRFVDGLEVLRRAAASASPGTGIYLLPSDAELADVEREFLERLAGPRLRELAADPPEEWTRAARGARLLRAVGEENEIRDAFRRILREGIPFDRVEILHTDASVYPALAWELSREHGIPCTFGGGVPATYSRPGQAALAFLDWVGGGFPSGRLREALASGLLTLRSAGEASGARDAHASATAREMRRARIGWGRRRHLTALDRRIRELEGPDRRSHRGEDDGDDAPAARRRAESRGRSLAAATQAKDFVSRALELAPDAAAPDALRTLARGARAFVAEFARVADELDGAAAEALDSLFQEIAELPAATAPLPEAVERLADAVRELSVSPDRPRPGRVHVTHYAAGGFSGRPHAFVLGLDDGRHPGRGLEDPVLLDDERREINASLERKALAMERERPRESARALRACLARLRGSVTASYSKFDLRNLSQAGEPSPSPFFLELYRESSGKPDADYGSMLEDLENAEGFVPDEDAALDETEWWLARLRGAGRRLEPGSASDLVRGAYPWLDDGHTAETARASGELTAWDGRLRGPTPELDPRVSGGAISATRIQELAKCPFSYFLKAVLRIESPDDLERESTRWLEPRDSGILLHDVFHAFCEGLVARGQRPDLERDTPVLAAIAAERIADWRERVPPPSELAFEAERESVLAACGIFLRDEAGRADRVTPRWFEVPFGLGPVKAGSIASADAVEIAVGSGRLRLTGKIDRVDEGADGTFHVWDYKTGSAFSVQEGKGLRGGRQAQPALYAMAVEVLLGRAGLKGRVSTTGYFFAGVKGEGQRIEVRVDAAETRDALSRLLDLAAAGMFPHAVSGDDCRFCDYKLICGGAEEAAGRAAEKLAAAADGPLAAFREIHEE
ncbi:MAG TPA: PD-(D/E)XK nuclease family protein [Thermoanaerobaculia bacterium]|nr:PD-(D/E)XK nuclease family protein [Thermoanaerobaculia bacterium]